MIRRSNAIRGHTSLSAKIRAKSWIKVSVNQPAKRLPVKNATAVKSWKKRILYHSVWSRSLLIAANVRLDTAVKKMVTDSIAERRNQK